MTEVDLINQKRNRNIQRVAGGIGGLSGMALGIGINKLIDYDNSWGGGVTVMLSVALMIVLSNVIARKWQH